MKRRAVIATILQALGVLTVSAAVERVSLWGGLLTLGVGLVAFGIAVERGDR